MDHTAFCQALQTLGLREVQMKQATEISKDLSDADREEFLMRLRDLGVQENTQGQEQSVASLEHANIDVEKMLKRQERTMDEQSEQGGELGQVEQQISQLP